MSSLYQYVVWLLYISLSSSTDLAAVYRDRILILRDADSVSPISHSWESLNVDLPRPLSYPVGLTYDAETNRLFVADAKPREEAMIISIFLNSAFEVVNMTTVVKRKSGSVVEGISYSPRSKHLYWTDALNHYIYKAPVQSGNSSVVSTIQDLGYTNSPRGLALDACNELLYWSEGGKSGKVHSSIEMWDPNGNKHHILEKDEEKDDFYQGLTFDDTSRTLFWAVTHGNDFNSTCRIVSTSVDEVHHQELVHLENCLPFSLTVDEKYTYWADWNRQGIMRASRSNPNDVVRLLHTPPDTDMKGDVYVGAYGIAKLNAGKMFQTSCEEKKEKSPEYEDKKLQNPTELSKSETDEESGKGTAKIKEVPDGSLDNVESTKLKQDSQHTEAKEIKHNSLGNVESTTLKEKQDDQHTEVKEMRHNIAEYAEPEGKTEKIREYDESIIAKSAPTGHSGTEENLKNKVNSVVYRDKIVKSINLTNMLIRSPASSSSIEPEQEAKLESVNTVTNVYNDKTQTDMIASHSTTEWYNESYLMTIVILAVISVMFLCSTIILAVLLYRRRAVPCKGTSAAALESPQAAIVKVIPRQVKRFGPKKSLLSGNKSGLSGSSTCSGLANDGVNINIEDCCQMTLCETPCYTTVKKQGKSYKDKGKHSKMYEYKKGLLDDCEDI